MKVGLLGHGVVGSGVQKIIDLNATEEIEKLEVVKILVKDESEINDPRCTTNVEDILNDPTIDIITECMGGLEPAHTFAKRALESGKHFVTSNKKMFATYCEELFSIAKEKNVAVHYEAACGGGIPWMASLDRTRRVDDIQSYRGIFNGTTNYILNRMSKEGTEFSDMLKEAQNLGYAEKDPSDDIDGFDVKYKVALSAVKAFDVIPDLDAITTYGIRHITTEELKYCHASGLEAKLIGTGINHGDTISAFVLPTFVSKEDVFASIPLNYNVIESNSKTLGPASYIGQGAGSLPTAHAVVQNLVDIEKNQDSKINEKYIKPVDNQLYKGVFYVRTKKPQLFESVVAEKIDGNAFLTKEISLEEIDLACKSVADETLFLAEVKK